MPIAYTDQKFQTIAEKMRAEAVPDIAISNFAYLYQQLTQGETGYIAESEISAVDGLTDSDQLDLRYAGIGEKALPRTVLLKLNGGLGTSMGLDSAKSLIRIKQDLSFLDITAEHAIHCGAQLLLMDSFNTRADTLNELKKFPHLNKAKLALDFVQHKAPKINQDDFTLAKSSENPSLEWYPPGHGDIYIALVSSGMLENLIRAGYRYAMISNIDNLGAVLDTRLLGYFIEEQIPFLMEATDRTYNDKKGGHLAQAADGRLLLRESAQCSEQDRSDFENVSKHRYFNTNNLWLDLQHLQDTLIKNNYVLNLPLIRNSKTIDPKNSQSRPVFQLETAMGSAISVFAGARAIRVPRTRFAPVKTSSDLLVLRSDIYEMSENYTLSSKLSFADLPKINLDKNYYAMLDDFEARFPAGSPSLIQCRSLDIEGDIVFGNKVSIKGDVKLRNRSNAQVQIASNSCLETDFCWD